jgi:hypothetical protein
MILRLTPLSLAIKQVLYPKSHLESVPEVLNDDQAGWTMVRNPVRALKTCQFYDIGELA